MGRLLQTQKITNPVKMLCTIVTASLFAERCLVASGSVDAIEVIGQNSPILTSVLFKANADEDTSSSEESVECRHFNQNKGTVRMAEDCQLWHVDFEIHGIVQGVFFRKHTQNEGIKLGLRGFCRNTRAGTVSGGMEGPRSTIDKMKYWLQNTGSPMSSISKAVFTNEKLIDEYTFSAGFDIKRTS